MPLLRSTTIRTRLFKTLILAIAVMVTVIVMVWRISVEPALRRSVATVQREVALRASDHIGDFLDQRIEELVATSEIARLWESKPTAQREALYRLLKLAPPIQEVSFADPGGRESIRLSRTRLFTASDHRRVAKEPSFQHAKRGAVYVGPIYHSASAEPFITVAVPAKFTALDIRGVLRAEISLKTLWGSIAHLRAGDSGYAFVIDRNGTLIAHPDYSKVLMGINMSRHPAVARLRQDPDQAQGLGKVEPGEEGHASIASVAGVRRSGWAVVVEESAETALAGVRRVERLGLGLLLMTVAGAFAMSYGFSERIARPIRELREGAGRIARGDLAHKLRIATGDEVEALAHEFNTMADRLQTSHAALEAEIVDKSRDLAVLYALTTPISEAGEIETVLDHALRRIVELVGADAAVIRFVDVDGRSTILSARGLSEESRHAIRSAALGGGLTQQALETGRVLITEDLATDARVTRGLLRDEGFRSAVYLPLRSPEGSAMLTVLSRTPRRWDERQRDLFTTIAHQIGVAVENVRLYAEVQRALAEVKAKNAELDSFVYSVSHDLKAPLVTMQGMAGLVLEDYGPVLDARGVRYLERLKANVEQMEQLICDLLALSRIGREARAPEAVSLSEVVDDVVADLAGLIQARGAKITVRDAAILWGIRTQLEQVMANLVSNAVKYAGQGEPPTVEIGAIARGAWVECSVRDNGIGIDPAYHERIFEVFQRLKEVEVDGTGVGLAIVKKIVESVGGRIWVESAPGQGATFRFTWPAERLT